MENEIRMIRKRFKCDLCKTKTSSLAYSNQRYIKCDCGSLANEITEDEYKAKSREEINKNYRYVNDNNASKSKPKKSEINSNMFNNNDNKQYNKYNTFNINNQNNFYNNVNNQNNHNNSYQNNRNNNPFNNNDGFQNNRTNRNQYNNFQDNRRYERNNGNFFNIINGIGQFFESGNRTHSNDNRRINREDNFFSDFFGGFGIDFGRNDGIFRHDFSDDIFDPSFNLFGSSFNDIFRTNFSSNFRSNFRNQDILSEYLNLITNNRTENKKPPTSKKTLQNLKRFKMSQKYCKSNQGKIELPNCSICISDIQIAEETILIPCGHMFHSKCILEWLNQSNTCPICRFELK